MGSSPVWLFTKVMSLSWTCKFCNRPTTVTSEDVHSFDGTLYIDNKDGRKYAKGTFIVCPNTKCKKLSFSLSLFKAVYVNGRTISTDKLQKHWQLLPPSNAKVFPSYVPPAIIKNYEEACLILEGSPNASATLSRRCLQGMVRDFFKVKKPENYKGFWTLADEIKSIKDKVELETWHAIDAVRKIGKIGAHMEEDVNTIVDVEAGEAEKLIWLIEALIKDWYINKHERDLNLEELKAVTEKYENKNKTEQPNTSAPE